MPPKLSDIRGHQRIRDYFDQLISGPGLAPVYLFTGPRGVGKASLALALARAMQCREAPGVGCDGCASCRKVDAETHPDIRWIVPTGGLTAAFSIDMVRELRKEVALAPWESERRFFVLDDVQRLTPPAGNALLKTLEEPPDYARMILVMSGMGDLLPTIESRCQPIRFGPLATDDVVRVLTDRGVPDGEARVAAALSGGSPGQAMASGSGLADCRARLIEVWEHGCDPAVAGRTLSQALMSGVDTGEPRREVARAGIDVLTSLCRDRLAACLGSSHRLHPDVPDELLDRLPSDVEVLLDELDALDDHRLAIDSNVDPRLILEDAGRLLAKASDG